MSDITIIASEPATAGPRRNRLASTPEPLTVNIRGASEMTGLGKRKLQELVANKTLDSTFVGGRRLLFVSSIKKLLYAGRGD